MGSDLSGGISLRFTAAVERARELGDRPYAGGRAAPPPLPGRRVRAIGDPQTSLDRFLRVLDAHELLGVDGFLADDVVLVSIGDHLDYKARDGSEPATDGRLILRWLAEHAPAQVVLLLGNHDVARVQELAAMTDARWAAARALAGALDEVAATRGDAAAIARARRFADEFPDVPAPGLARRDYAAFAEAQRALVVALLLAGRYRLGAAATLADGRDALLTHAGVTVREVELLGAPARPAALAAALDRRLADAVDARRAAWRAGDLAPLDLAPLHLAGAQPHEGGGLLYHRPANPARDAAPGREVERAWEGERRRRFHPGELPRGLVQVAGHTTHKKSVDELRPWPTDAAVAWPHGTLRTLVAGDDRVVYDVGIAGAGAADLAVLHLIDAEMNEVTKDPEDYPLLDLAAVIG